MDEAERIYRELHPRMFPYSPWERQMELRDLWPSEQAKFRLFVAAPSNLAASASKG